jgi:hypothetical protein
VTVLVVINRVRKRIPIAPLAVTSHCDNIIRESATLAQVSTGSYPQIAFSVPLTSKETSM